MSVRIACLYDLDDAVRAFLQEIYESDQTAIVTHDRRPRLVIMPYKSYCRLAKCLADVGDVVQELAETVRQAESRHPFQDLREDLIDEGVLDAL